MSQKDFVFQEGARQKLLEGICSLSSRFAPSFGPNKETIETQISFIDPHMNMGASLAQEMFSKVEKLSGDGTVLSLILLSAFIKEGLEMLSKEDVLFSIKKGIEKAFHFAIEFIKAHQISIQNDITLKKIALLFVNRDEHHADLVCQAFQKAGKNRLIFVKGSSNHISSLELSQGIYFNKGYVSAYFCSDREREIIEIEDAKLLITSDKIHSIQEILPFLQAISSTTQQLVIIAQDFDHDVISTLTMNKLKGILNVYPVKTLAALPKEILEEIALCTGATLISKEKGCSLTTAEADVLGFIKGAIIRKDSTLLEIYPLRSGTHEKEEIAIIHAAKTIDSALKIELDKAIAAVKSSLENGVVIGGGACLLRLSQALDPLAFEKEERLGVSIVKKGLEAPFRQLVKNAGGDPSLYVEKMFATPSHTKMGFNALTGQIEDLEKGGILDPVKTILTSLECAILTACNILFSDVIMADAKEKKRDM